MAKITLEELKKTLWAAADSSRGVVDSSIFKDYILTFLFFKYLSDQHKVEVEKLKTRYGNDKARLKNKLKLKHKSEPKQKHIYQEP